MINPTTISQADKLYLAIRQRLDKSQGQWRLFPVPREQKEDAKSASAMARKVPINATYQLLSKDEFIDKFKASYPEMIGRFKQQKQKGNDFALLIIPNLSPKNKW